MQLPSATPVYGLVVQLVRTPACHAGGHGFKSRSIRQFMDECSNGKMRVSKALRLRFESLLVCHFIVGKLEENDKRRKNALYEGYRRY